MHLRRPLSVHLCRRAALVVLCVAGWLGISQRGVETAPAQPDVATAPADAAATRAMLDRYCVGCHNDRLQSGGLALDAVDAGTPAGHADVWERVIQKLRTGSMPPGGRPRPSVETYHAVAQQLETALDRAAAVTPAPGRTSTVHRLNRTEYHHAIRDLLAVDVDVTALLPGDETSDTGFDNNAEVLSITTAQLERYLSAARHITRLATGLPPTGPGFETFAVPLLLLQDDRQAPDLPLGSRGGAAIRYHFPADGEYLIKIRLRTNWQDYILGMGTAQQLDVRIDGALVKRFTVGGDATGRPAPVTFTIAEPGAPEWEAYVLNADDDLEVRVPVEAGPRVVGVSFVRQRWEPEGVLQVRQAGEVLSNDEAYYGNAAVDSVAIGGPYDVTGSSDTPSRDTIFSCRPQDAADERPCAARIFSTLARRAYRRPVTDADLGTLLAFFDQGRAAGGSFDAGVQLALERLLVDPDFLLRLELDPPTLDPGTVYRLSDIEIASRLSFFLWSSLPDDPLLAAAENGTLRDPAVLERQVRRMLADPRAVSLVDDFATQWLHLRNLDDVRGDPVPFPDYDDNLVEAFREETELFLTSTLREDHSVLELLRADYTFVNERLARHYDIPGVYGTRFRRVTLPDLEQRGGLLGHGSLLALTSYPTRTSPVLRGKWLLDTILDAPPPSPPPDVPALPDRGEGGRPESVRERLERHRSAPTCAACHSMIDPPGFALEQFDGMGAWRSVYAHGAPIDASAVMPNGVTVTGLSGLRAMLLDQPEQFAKTVTSKLLSFALGRQLDYYDRPTVRQVVRDAATDDYRWSSLILGVVRSPAFLMRTAGTP
jgi:mono/diheme cytochrome c family protein